jgi:DNA-binding NarL/FixJ family response regulator
VPIRVLIVDDTESLRELMRVRVEQAGLEVVAEAGDGAEAVRRAQDSQPDVVILDVEMPVMDGLQALPSLKEVAPAARVIVFSSRTDPATETAARDHGAAAFFHKGRTTSRDVAAFARSLFPDTGDSSG